MVQLIVIANFVSWKANDIMAWLYLITNEGVFDTGVNVIAKVMRSVGQ